MEKPKPMTKEEIEETEKQTNFEVEWEENEQRKTRKTSEKN